MTWTATSSSRFRTRRRPAPAARRFGYAVAITVSAAMLYTVNVWPGWDAVPFLTGDTVDVLDPVNASVIATLTANVIFLWRDPPRLKAAADAVTTAIGLIALVAIWQIFPLDLSSAMETPARILLGIGLVGSVIGVLSALARLVRPSTV